MLVDHNLESLMGYRPKGASCYKSRKTTASVKSFKEKMNALSRREQSSPEKTKADFNKCC